MNREELADEIDGFLEYVKDIKSADSFNVVMAETILGAFATWLHGRHEKLEVAHAKEEEPSNVS